jgi:molybdopterin-synthase adenylyltransferase
VSLGPEALERYARHIVLREIGGPGQRRLGAARVVVVGAGGLGSPALLYLAAAGVGRIAVVDDDRVSLSNLQRQVLHQTGEIGAFKAESAARALARVNPLVAVEARVERLEEANAAGLLAGADLVLDGSDSFATRYLVNRTAAAAGVPLIAAAMSQWEGQISIYHPAGGGPCFACIFPEPPAAGLAPTCAEAGIVGALPGVMGSMMALEAIKWIAGAGRSLVGRMLIYDALDAEVRTLRIGRREGCGVCGEMRGDAGVWG